MKGGGGIRIRGVRCALAGGEVFLLPGGGGRGGGGVLFVDAVWADAGDVCRYRSGDGDAGDCEAVAGCRDRAEPVCV